MSYVIGRKVYRRDRKVLPSVAGFVLAAMHVIMAIIISKGGKNAKKIETSNFEEDYLQQYIYNNPDSIPLYDIKKDIQLLILAREFSTKSGRIDAIGVDKDGEIYIVETKLYKNPDKRLVVAQVLDYGASLWRSSYGDFNELLVALTDDIQKEFGVSLEQRLKDFFNIEEGGAAALFENMRLNFSGGNFRFVILMDKLHDQLKDLVVFINQNSKFDIFPIEFEYYKYEDYEIMIPRLFGAEVKKDIAVSSSGRREYREWNEESFFQDARSRIHDKSSLTTLSELYKFSKENADAVEWGSGTGRGTFTFKIVSGPEGNRASVFTVWSDGFVNFRFGNIQRNISQKAAEALYEKFRECSGMESKEYMFSSKGFALKIPVKEVFPSDKALIKFKQAVVDFQREVKDNI